MSESNSGKRADKVKVTVISGCSRGIGLHIALKLSQKQDYNVIATLRDLGTVPQVLGNATCDIQALDVTNEESAEKLAQYVKDTYGGCDVLINNSGLAIAGNLECVSFDHAKSVFDVNVWGVMRMVRCFAPLMRLRGGGLIVTVSSVVGFCGLPGFDIYASSKHAVEGLLSSYRYTVEKDNIKVTLINPGPVATGIGKIVNQESEKTNHYSNDCSNQASVDYYASLLNQRLDHGQSVDDCAEELVQAVCRDVNKCIVGGQESVRLWNPTGQESKRIMNDLLRRPDGHSGTYSARFAMAREADEIMGSACEPK